MDASTTLWLEDPPRPQPTRGPVWVGPTPPGPNTGILVIPVEADDGVRAVALVPEASTSPVARNGRPLGPGLHELRHSDRLDVGEAVVWLSGQRTAEATSYQPGRHPPGAHCARTRRRLVEGEAIVLCPGTPTRDCNLIFQAEAWALELPCHRCRHDPRAPAWSPPLVPKASRVDELLHLARSNVCPEA